MRKHHIVLEPSKPITELKVTDVFSAYDYFYSPQYSFKGESHAAWELVYVNFGEVIIETPEYEHILTKGQALLHIPGEFHKIRANNTSCNPYIVCFRSSCKKLYSIAQKVINFPAYLIPYLFSVVEEGRIFLAGKNNMSKNQNKPSFASGQIVKNLIEILLIGLVRQGENKHQGREQLSRPSKITVMKNTIEKKSVVGHIINYLSINLHKKIKLKTIADYVGYSVPHICAIFKKETGDSIINYYINLRINKAKQLMAEDRMNLRQISESLDFDSIQYFSSQFKKVTGIMPSQYLAHIKVKKYNFDENTDLRVLKTAIKFQ